MGFFSFFKKKKKTEQTKPQSAEAAVNVKAEAITESTAPKTEKPAITKEPEAEEKKVSEAATITENSEIAEEQKKKTSAKSQDKKVEEKAAEEAVCEPTSSAGEKITGRFEIKKAKDGRYVFNLYASNHVIVATSQVYSSSKSALVGINSVIANSERAPIEDQTLKSYETFGYPKWEIYMDKGQQYRFRLYASNGSCICHSQGYTTKTSCKKGIESIIRSSRNAEIDKSYLKKEEK